MLVDMGVDVRSPRSQGKHSCMVGVADEVGWVPWGGGTGQLLCGRRGESRRRLMCGCGILGFGGPRTPLACRCWMVPLNQLNSSLVRMSAEGQRV